MNEIQRLIIQLMDDYGDYLKKTAYVMIGDRYLAEDLVQETFFGFYKSHHRFRKESSYKTYLYRILMNNIKMQYRKKRDIIFEEVDAIEPIVTFEDQVVYSMDLHQGINRLDMKQRQVIVLYYFNDMTVEEVSKVLNISRSAVKMRLKRGREALGTYLKGGESYEEMESSNE